MNGIVEQLKNAEPAPPDTSGLHQSDIAALVAEKMANRYLWDETAGEWVTKANVAWRPCKASVIQRAASREIKALKGGYTLSYLTAVVGLLKIELTAPEWTTDRHLLPFSNGVFNLRTGGFSTTCFKPSQPSQSSLLRSTALTQPSQIDTRSSQSEYFNWELPYQYNSQATCWTFRRWLITATAGDRDLIRFLLAWLVALLRGRSDLQKYLEMTGAGGTGKSTFMRICTLIVGEQNRLITDLKNLEGRFETANLYRKRLAQITDSAHYAGEVSTLKSITGGDPIRYEVKNRQAGESFVFSGLVMIAANEVIKSSDYTSGVSRRRIPVHMNQRVPETEKNRYKRSGGIEEVLQQEAAGIINWILSLDESEAVEIVKNPSGSVGKYKLEAELQSNPVLSWANESLSICEEGQEHQIGSKTPKGADEFEVQNDIDTRLYPNYRQWCDGQDRKPISLNRFSGSVIDTLKFWGIDTDKGRQSGTGKTILKYLRIKNPAEPNLLDSVKAVKAKSTGESSTARTCEGCEGCEDQNTTLKFATDDFGG